MNAKRMRSESMKKLFIETNRACMPNVNEIQHKAWKIMWLNSEKDRLRHEYERRKSEIEQEIEVLQKAISNSNCTSTVY